MSQAEALFAKFLADFANFERPPSAEFEALCAAHPSLSNALRQLKSDRDRVQSLAERAGPGARSDSRERAPLSERLRARFGQDVDPGVALGGKAPEPDSAPSSELLERLRAHAPSSSRYQLLGEVGRGGMGAVLRIWDEDLRRTLAMKVVLGKEDATKAGDTPPVDPKTLGRFLEEAQITGQLDHPGIVPVHELGLGADGRVYFTMRLVKGEDLRRIYEHVETGHDGWNETRALTVLLKVCEAMSYAHDKGVVHRDLKPANVMVGKYGEAYVMDWGLARVQGQQDRHDVRIQPEAAASASVRTERRAARDDTPDSPLVTMDGDVVGTPAYMAPEQARGDVERLGPHSDVYSVGAMLYHLLARQMPFVPRGTRPSQHAVLMRLLEGPPRSLVELAPRAPAELIAICGKAMERDTVRRYRDMNEIAADVRAFLERRVVKAYERGTWAETKKWVQRNKPLAASLTATFLVALLGVGWVSAKNAQLERAYRVADVARQDTDTKNQRLIVSEREARVRGMIAELGYLESLDDHTYGHTPSREVPTADWWLERAQQLVRGTSDDSASNRGWSPGLQDAKAELGRVRARALRRAPAASDERVPLDESVEWQFASLEDTWWHGELVKLVEGLQLLANKVDLAEASVRSRAAVEAWTHAIDAILSSDKYQDTHWPNDKRLRPQLGLIPIGPDPESGLWEFAHLATGTPARRGADGKLILDSDVGLVFVLLPEGRVPDETDEHSDQDRSLTAMTLDPFFLSKYEMTHQQWTRLGGWRRFEGGDQLDGLLPATDLSWNDCVAALSRLGWIELPTEAQWEYGCRSGTTTKWWKTNDVHELPTIANLRHGEDVEAHLIPIGRLRANGFGLHDMHGNVSELCLDAYSRDGITRRPGDGLNDVPDAPSRVRRGGSCWCSPNTATASCRFGPTPGDRDDDIGLRPARGITP